MIYTRNILYNHLSIEFTGTLFKINKDEKNCKINKFN